MGNKQPKRIRRIVAKANQNTIMECNNQYLFCSFSREHYKNNY